MSAKNKHLKIKRLSNLLVWAVLIIALVGCDSNEYVVIESKYHPSEWSGFPLPGFHGTEGLKKGIGECYQCHGHDLSGGITDVACSECHGGGLDNCVACHGGLNDSTGAPPYGLRGMIDDTALAVDAHNSHLNGLLISDGVPCGSCHIVPEHPWDTTHFDFSIYDGTGTIDSIAEIIWGDIENAGGLWSRETKSCTNTYCHGNFNYGYTDNSPVWTETDQALCGSCHDDGNDIFQMNRGHIFHYYNGVGCESCHASTVDEGLNIIGPQLHVDGQINIKFIPDIGTFSDGLCDNTGGCHDIVESWD